MNKNCFAYKGKCTLLNKPNCDRCRFYKTKKQYAQDRLSRMSKEIDFLSKKNPNKYTACYLGKLVSKLKSDL